MKKKPHLIDMLALPKTRFNWIPALEWCIKHPELIDRSMFEKLIKKSGSWPTCACGQACKGLPRAVHTNIWGEILPRTDAPADGILRDLGYDFHDYVRNSRWRAALRTMRQIEKRSAKLLRELNRKKK